MSAEYDAIAEEYNAASTELPLKIVCDHSLQRAVGDAGDRARGLARTAREGFGSDCAGALRSTCAEIDAWLAGPPDAR